MGFKDGSWPACREEKAKMKAIDAVPWERGSTHIRDGRTFWEDMLLQDETLSSVPLRSTPLCLERKKASSSHSKKRKKENLLKSVTLFKMHEARTRKMVHGIYTSHIHCVVWGTGTPKNRDEVNRREVWECDGWVCDLETIGVPSIFMWTRKHASLCYTHWVKSFFLSDSRDWLQPFFIPLQINQPERSRMFLQLQEFSQHNQTWELRTSTFAARCSLISWSENADLFLPRQLLYVLILT